MNQFLKKRYLIFISLLIVLLLPSCKDDNKGYDEFYNSMGNNPAMVIPWMERLVRDLRKTHAMIQAYTYNDEIYYTLQTYEKKNGVSVSPYTIYEGNEDDKIIFYHTDDLLKVTPSSDSLYFDFKDNAIFQFFVWKNVPKADDNIEF